jgi:hypothetical protein
VAAVRPSLLGLEGINSGQLRPLRSGICQLRPPPDNPSRRPRYAPENREARDESYVLAQRRLEEGLRATRPPPRQPATARHRPTGRTRTSRQRGRHWRRLSGLAPGYWEWVRSQWMDTMVRWWYTYNAAYACTPGYTNPLNNLSFFRREIAGRLYAGGLPQSPYPPSAQKPDRPVYLPA